MRTSALKPRRGVSALYTVIILVALCGFVSLGVDVGHVQVAKNELQTAADAAVRAAAEGFARSGPAAARDAAIEIAAANTCDGSSVILDRTADIELGTWDDDTKAFTALAGPAEDSANAIRITARRIAARSTAIPLTFARVVGRNTCDVHATATVKFSRASTGGFIGLNGMAMKNTSFFGSYNASTNPFPTESSATSGCMIGSNGTIDVGNKTVVRGDIVLGPDGAVSGSIQTSGSTLKQSSPLETPQMPKWEPEPNPAGVSQSYTVSKSGATLPGGTYWFTSLTISGDLSFSGPATVYVNGNITVDADLIAAGNLPANLKIYQLGTGRTFGDNQSNNFKIVARITAPGADFVAKNKATFLGSATFNTMTFKNATDCFYDETGGPKGRAIISMVK